MNELPVMLKNTECGMKNYKCKFYDFCLDLCCRENWDGWTCEFCKNINKVLPENIIHYKVNANNHVNSECIICGKILSNIKGSDYCKKHKSKKEEGENGENNTSTSSSDVPAM